MKHTTGPWMTAATPNIGCPAITDADGWVIAPRIESAADARLIAAAPAMLDALRDLVACTPETYDNRHELRAAIDAIAAATGEQ